MKRLAQPRRSLWLVLGLLIAGLATVAAAGTIATPNFGFNFGTTPYSDTITLAQPIAAGNTFNVANTSGRTSVRGRPR